MGAELKLRRTFPGVTLNARRSLSLKQIVLPPLKIRNNFLISAFKTTARLYKQKTKASVSANENKRTLKRF
jgi:hypothetical protein